MEKIFSLYIISLYYFIIHLKYLNKECTPTYRKKKMSTNFPFLKKFGKQLSMKLVNYKNYLLKMIITNQESKRSTTIIILPALYFIEH